MPRYTRENPTRIGKITAMTTVIARANRLRVQLNTISATPTVKTVAAAVCPDGKLDVDGVEFKRGTSGRGLPIKKVTDRNTVISTTSASTNMAASPPRRAVAGKPATTAAATITGSVSTIRVATSVM